MLRNTDHTTSNNNLNSRLEMMAMNNRDEMFLHIIVEDAAEQIIATGESTETCKPRLERQIHNLLAIDVANWVLVSPSKFKLLKPPAVLSPDDQHRLHNRMESYL